MTVASYLAWITMGLTLLPALMTGMNLVFFRSLPVLRGRCVGASAPPVSVSLLIPARDEAGAIGACLDAVLAAAEGFELEVIVLDDHSTDGTASIVNKYAERDPRVRLESAPPLPEGWNGKQHACWVLAQRATHETLMWIDADVRLQPGAIGRAADALRRGSASLISGFPFQETRTLAEKLVVPQIQAVLLGYLPMIRMRHSASPGYGAGCGQWFIAARQAYRDVGGHAEIRRSIHDGVALPRLFRRAGYLTDLFDATDTARCRMYHDLPQVWNGFAKNATEGMAGPRAILPWTVLLLGGWVMPWVMLLLWGLGYLQPYTGVVFASAAVALGLSVVLGIRFRQGVGATLLRPVGVATLVAIQWYALGRKLAGRPSEWRGRAYAAG